MENDFEKLTDLEGLEKAANGGDIDAQNELGFMYATGNGVVSQLIDLALLGNGLLKGEALSNFIKRSAQFIS